MVNWHFILFLFIFLKKSLQEAHLRRSFFLMCCSRSKEAHFKTICGQEIAASTRLLDLYTSSFSIAEQIYPKLQRNDTPSYFVSPTPFSILLRFPCLFLFLCIGWAVLWERANRFGTAQVQDTWLFL